MTAPSAMAAVNAPTADNPEKRPKHMQLRPDWENVKLPIMEDIVQAKFTQNEDLKELLLAKIGAASGGNGLCTQL